MSIDSPSIQLELGISGLHLPSDLPKSDPALQKTALNIEQKMLKIFIGYDPRQSISYSVLQHSLLKRSSKPLQITPLVLEQLPINRKGLTPFTFTRFLVPWLCDYQGWALFMDADIIALDDIAKLFEYADDRYAIVVSKNKHQFEWASVMLFNCAKCQMLTPEVVQSDPKIFTFHYLQPEELGEFPGSWNHLVGYDPEKKNQSMVHFTQGVPAFPEVAGCEYTNEWANEFSSTFNCEPWAHVMGHSVHTGVVNGTVVPKFKAKAFYHQQGVYTRELPSERYENLIALYTQLHEKGDPELKISAENMFSGITLPQHAEKIHEFLKQFQIKTLLDYGCGKAQQYKLSFQTQNGEVFPNIPTYWESPKIYLYDPGFKPFKFLPQGQFDAVISTDVLEHLPEEDLNWILKEILNYARHAVYLSVATYPARKKLPNGENAHITVRPSSWWQELIGGIRNQHYPHLSIQLAIDSVNEQGKMEREYVWWKA